MDQLNYDSSMEELSPEELRMLASTKRQEPQGEEHTGGTTTKLSSEGKLEIASSGSSSSTPYSSEDDGVGIDQRQPQNRHRLLKKQQQYYQRTGGGKPGNPSNVSGDSTNSHSAYNTLIIHQNNSSLLADTWIPATHEFTSYGVGNQRQDESQPQPPRPTHSYSNPYEHFLVDETGNNNSALTSSELSEIPRDYLNQLTVLKHLAKEVKQDPVSGTTGSSLLRSASFSKSQPDLTQTGTRVQPIKAEEGIQHKPQTQAHARKKKQDGSTCGEGANEVVSANTTLHQDPQQDDVTPSVQILEILMRENAALNTELVNARRKIATIHKLEAELDRLQASHEALFASAERRESLERTARAKLNTELKRLTAVNRELMSSGSLQNLSPSPYAASTADIELLKKEIAKRDFTIAQLLAQNKDLAAVKERQDIELSAQRATLGEQRTHIDILDSALTNAQANVLRLEEECRKKQEFVDKSSQLQRALSSLQLSQDKKEQTEKKVRSQLEGEISDLKLRLASLNVTGSTSISRNPGPTQRSYQSPPYTPPKYESNSNLTENQLQVLHDKLKASEEQIYQLNSQVAKWDTVFSPGGYRVPQSSVRNASASNPDTPNSWNSNSRGGTPHFFGGSGNSEKISLEELQLQGRSNDLEWKVKELESRLMEKDAMIRILQTVPASSPSPYGGAMPNYRDSPGYSQASVSLASMSMIDTPNVMYSKGLISQKCESEPPSYANLPIKLRLGGSGSSLVKNSNESLQLGSGGSNTGGNSPNISGPGSISSVAGVGKSIEDQLKDLDNHLLSKDGGGGGGGGGTGGGGTGSLKMNSGLCCIPGFPHPSSATRKGKIPQSLLESITVGTVVLGVGGTSGLQNTERFGRKTSILPPKPPTNQSNSSNQDSSGGRTSSGPPFLPSDQSPMLSPLVATTTALSLSNSVDSVLSDPPPQDNDKNTSTYVFSPAVGIPTGLPPKPTTIDSQTAKSRSLERSKYLNPGEHSTGKYAMYDSSRCRSLDRRELKVNNPVSNLPVSTNTKPEEEKKEVKNLKSSVSSKAAFFGQLLTRRSPSPGRDKKDSTPKMSRRFPFGSSKSSQAQAQAHQSSSSSSSGEVAEERMMLDKQGRQSQRNRISSKWSSCNTLEAVEEQSGSESPWTCRKSKGSPKVSKKVLKDHGQRGEKDEQVLLSSGEESSSGKKWGRIVKTPFGLRYTFGSPRVVTPVLDTSSSPMTKSSK